MAEKYDHHELERRWQDRWDSDALYRSEVDWDRPKHYALTMLPYTSGDLHIGHWYAMVPSDARARLMRMKGYNVLFPMGFDAFGLPAENAAIKSGVHPATWTWANIERMREQLRTMGTMFDWEREAISCDPSYYVWTEWLFRRLYEGGLAYRGEAIVNWSPALQTVLANEQVIDGKDERTGAPVEQRKMEQWFFAITKYAEELLDFSAIDWAEPVKVMQANWIGRSEGADVVFTTEGGDQIPVFTTRPDTLWGATFMVLAPEHDLVDALTSDDQRVAVDEYREVAGSRSEIERMEVDREKTGVFTGGYALNPVNGAKIPVWIADYVLLSYGSGAIMAVPAHDERDFAFARAMDLPVVSVIHPEGADPLDGETMTESYVGPGVMVNSGPIDGVETTDAKGRENPSVAATLDWLEGNGLGTEAVNYRMRDWLISRQRYWGAPIPMLYREDGTIEPEQNLPVILPEDLVVTGGASPLTTDEAFLAATDSDGEPATRETDTMDTFMCSSWYHYRYLSPGFGAGPFDPEEAAYWLPVDVYTGGAEHATMHLLYTRFFTKALRDLGVFDETAAVMESHGRDPTGLFDEPMLMSRNQGQILGEERTGDRLVIAGQWRGDRLVAESVRVDDDAPLDAAPVVGELLKHDDDSLQVATTNGVVTVEIPDDAAIEIPGAEGPSELSALRAHVAIQRMSKSRGNVVNPDELVERYGADTVRTHLMFAFDWEKGGPWDSHGIVGSRRFVDDVWKLATTQYEPTTVSQDSSAALRRLVHQTIQKVDRDMTAFKWNTAVAALMTLRNRMLDERTSREVSTEAWDEAVSILLLLLAPIAPHITEELWHRGGNVASIHLAAWPEADAAVATEPMVTLVVQVNGKVRDRIEVAPDIDEETATAAAMASERIQAYLEHGEVRKVIARPPGLVNIVIN
ncbi:MAG: leucine--tRNA ligase [Acidimicrobiia bacterium]|nr:MAG: leucine--tRNA ligase [Acidimicrobiia bacterium]